MITYIVIVSSYCYVSSYYLLYTTLCPHTFFFTQVDSKVRERLRGLVSANDDSLTAQVHWLNLEICASICTAICVSVWVILY